MATSISIQRLASNEAKNVAGIIKVIAQAANGDTPVDALRLRDKSSDDFALLSYENGVLRISDKLGKDLIISGEDDKKKDNSKLVVKELVIESESGQNTSITTSPNGELEVENLSTLTINAPVKINNSLISSVETEITNVPVYGHEDSSVVTSRAYVNALYNQISQSIEGFPSIELMRIQSKNANIFFDSQGLGYSVINSSYATICEKKPSNSQAIFVPKIIEIPPSIDNSLHGFYLVDKCSCSGENWKNVKCLNAPYISSISDVSILDAPSIVIAPKLTSISGSFSNWTPKNHKLLLDFSSLNVSSISPLDFDQVKLLKLNVNFHHQDLSKDHLFINGSVETVKFISNDEGSINIFDGVGKNLISTNEPNVFYPAILRMIDMEDGLTQFNLFKEKSLNFSKSKIPTPISLAKIHIY